MYSNMFALVAMVFATAVHLYRSGTNLFVLGLSLVGLAILLDIGRLWKYPVQAEEGGQETSEQSPVNPPHAATGSRWARHVAAASG